MTRGGALPGEARATGVSRAGASRARHVLRLATGLISTLALAEASCRLLLPRPYAVVPPAASAPGLFIPHLVRGYALSPGARVEAPVPGGGGGRVIYEINGLGLRDRSVQPDDWGGLVLALGDSFTFGLGVGREEAWPAQLEAQAFASGGSMRVLNAGVTGYSVRQCRLLLDELLETGSPRLVLVGVYASRGWRVESPYVYCHGRLVRAHDASGVVEMGRDLVYTPFARPSLRSLDLWADRYFWTGARLLKLLAPPPDRVLPESSADPQARLAPLLREVDRMAETACGRGIPFALLLVSHQEPDGTFSDDERTCNRAVMSHCVASAIPVLDLLPDLEEAAFGAPILRLGGDSHWSPAAHDIAARAAWRFLADTGLWPE